MINNTTGTASLASSQNKIQTDKNLHREQSEALNKINLNATIVRAARTSHIINYKSNQITNKKINMRQKNDQRAG